MYQPSEVEKTVTQRALKKGSLCSRGTYEIRMIARLVGTCTDSSKLRNERYRVARVINFELSGDNLQKLIIASPGALLLFIMAGTKRMG